MFAKVVSVTCSKGFSNSLVFLHILSLFVCCSLTLLVKKAAARKAKVTIDPQGILLDAPDFR